MRICFITSYPLKFAGVEVYASKTVEHLVKKGHKVHVITYSYGQGFHGENVEVLPTLNAPLLRGVSFILHSTVAILKKKHVFHVLNAHIPFTSGLPCAFLPRKSRPPLVITCHGTEIARATGNPFLKKILLEILGRADHVITVSDFLKKELMKLGFKGKVSVVRGGVDRKLFHDNISREEAAKIIGLNANRRYILFVGALKERKGVFTLIKAFHRLTSSMEKVSLIMAGSGEELGEVRRLLKKLNLTSHVLLTGSVHYFKLPFLFRASDVFVFPSYYEGFGLTALEAMSCGVPVICSNIEGINEVTGDAALKFNPGNTHELYEKMLTLLENEGLRAEYSCKGINRAKLFSWEKTARETLKIFRSVQTDTK